MPPSSRKGQPSATEEVTARPLSDVDFEPEMQRISAQLEDKTNWERRLAALRELRAVVLADISTKRNFQSVFSATMKAQLKAQVEDLRSAISREACNVVQALCTNCENKTNWEYISDWYLQSLFNNSCATVAVIAESAVQTLHIVAACGYISRHAMACVLRNCASKHAIIRRNAFQCLLLILQNCDPSHNQRHAQQICETVRAGVHDALQEARKIARMCYWGLENICYDEALALLDGCEPQVQRAINDERKTYLEWLDDGEAAALPSPHKRTALGGSAVPVALSTASSSSSLKAAAGSGAPQSPASGSVGQSEVPSAASSGRAPVEKKPASAPAKRTPSANPPTTSGGPRSGAPASSAPTGGASAAVHRDPTSGVVESAAVVAAANPPSYASRQRSKVPAASGARGAAHHHAPSASGGPGVGSAAPRSRSSDPTGNEDSWLHIQSTISGSDWAARVNAFNGIAELAELKALVPARAIETVELILKHSNDTHYRVVAAALLCLEKLLEQVPEHVFPALDRILTCLLTKTHDPKDAVREVAGRLLERIPFPFGPDAVLPATLKVIDAASAKVRATTCDYMLHLAQCVPNYFTSSSNVKAFLSKLLVVAVRLNPGDSKIARGVGAMMAQMYATSREIVVALLVGMPVADREAAAALLKPFVPHVQQDIRRAADKERLLPHPDVVVTSNFGRGGGAPSTGASPLGSAKKSPGGKSGRFAGGARGAAGEKSVTPASLLYDYDEEGNEQAAPRMQQLATGDGTSGVRNNPGAGGYNPRAYDPTAARNADGFRGGAQSTFSTLLGHKKPIPDEISALRNSATSEEKRQAVLDAGDSLTLHPRLWEDHYATILPYALAFANDTDHTIRTLALQWLRAIQDTRPLLTQANDAALDHFLRCAVVSLDDPYPEVQSEGAALLRTALTHSPIGLAVQMLLDVCQEVAKNPATSTRVFQQTLRQLGELCVRDGRAAIDRWAPRFLPAIVEFLTSCFADEHSDIRKTVVLNFVDLYALLGHELLPLIRHLSVSQLKLISIYHTRAMAGPSGGGPQTDLLREMQAMNIV